MYTFVISVAPRVVYTKWIENSRLTKLHHNACTLIFCKKEKTMASYVYITITEWHC